MIRTARIRPDQVTPEQIDGVCYALSELAVEAQSFYDVCDPYGEKGACWRDVMLWLQRKIEIANGINPYTGEEFTSEELDMIKKFEYTEQTMYE